MVIPSLPPTINHTFFACYSRATHKARIYKSAIAKKYQKYLHDFAVDYKDQVDPASKYALVIKTTQPNNRRDVDNCIKLIQDGIVTGLGLNDRSVFMILSYKRVSKKSTPTMEIWFGAVDDILELLPSIRDDIKECVDT
jgi:Holliday junction resolvase RusA-like endonuclease